MAAVENMYFIAVLLYAIYYFIKNKVSFIRLRIEQRFAFIASFLLIILFGSYLYNLGLGNRMRVMFLPYLFYVLITVINSKSQNETSMLKCLSPNEMTTSEQQVTFKKQ